jgi:diguanylate cyclase (GGDEF)-like protein
MSTLAERLRANELELVERWQAWLATQPASRRGALAGAAPGNLGGCVAGVLTLLERGDGEPLRQTYGGLIAGNLQFPLAETQRELAGLRRIGREAVGTAAELQEWDGAVDEALATLAETYQAATADHERARMERVYELEEKLATTNSRDSATGVFTRAFFRERLSAEWRISDRYRRPLALLIVALDGLEALKGVEEGHAEAQALRAVANMLVGSSRAADLVARLGVDRFAMILPETDGIGASQLAERFCARARDLDIAGAPAGWSLRLSAGVAHRRDEIAGAEELLRRAEAALARARAAGGDSAEWDG